MNGHIARLKPDRGFGFIRAAEGRDVFFHRSAVLDGNFDLLREGDEVSYELENSPRGPRAKNVRQIS